MEDRTEQQQAAYENACVCLYNGYGRNMWNSCGLSEEEADKIWNEAYFYMIDDLPIIN